MKNRTSVVEPGAATFRVAPEPEPIFLLAGPIFEEAPAASFRKAEQKSLFLVLNMTLKQFIKVPENMTQKKTCRY